MIWDNCKQSELKEEHRKSILLINSTWEHDPVREGVLIWHLCPRAGYFALSKSGKGYVWHLVGRGQACCTTAYNAQDSPQNREWCSLKKQYCGWEALGSSQSNWSQAFSSLLTWGLFCSPWVSRIASKLWVDGALRRDKLQPCAAFSLQQAADPGGKGSWGARPQGPLFERASPPHLKLLVRRRCRKVLLYPPHHAGQKYVHFLSFFCLEEKGCM